MSIEILLTTAGSDVAFSFFYFPFVDSLQFLGSFNFGGTGEVSEVSHPFPFHEKTGIPSSS